jgi:hypothetical protein
MNSDRFDKLTRSLGNTVSRRDALKLFAVGVVGLLTGLPTLGEAEAASDSDWAPCPKGKRGAPFPRDPRIPGGGKCRGACGVGCEGGDCTPQPKRRICATGKNGHDYICTYPNVISCGTAKGCREHDACYDKAEAAGEISIWGPRHRRCDAICINDYTLPVCNSWRKGLCYHNRFGYICDGRRFFSSSPIIEECPDCTRCNPDTFACDPVVCPDPCQECKNNTCQSKCDACSICVNGNCVSTCPECTTCNPNTGACEPCRACQFCQDGACVDQCGECSHCGPEGCLPDCVTGEHCCGGQCINLSEYQCCGSANAHYPCPWGTQCCAGSQTCCDPTVEQCCGGACMPYGNSNCLVGACIGCGAGQICCLNENGTPHGCCAPGQICDPENGCTAGPTISAELPVWQGPNR